MASFVVPVQFLIRMNNVTATKKLQHDFIFVTKSKILLLVEELVDKLAFVIPLCTFELHGILLNINCIPAAAHHLLPLSLSMNVVVN